LLLIFIRNEIDILRDSATLDADNYFSSSEAQAPPAAKKLETLSF
jgi:hypothetical protein